MIAVKVSSGAGFDRFRVGQHVTTALLLVVTSETRHPLPRTDIHTRWGRAVPVGPREEEPSDERVEEVFCRYVTELRSLQRSLEA